MKKSAIRQPPPDVEHGNSKYLSVYADQAYRYALLGMTDKEVSVAFETSERTIRTWKSKHSAFASALKRGRELANGQVAAALFKRATGTWTQPAIKIMMTRDGKVVKVPYVERFAPDITAMIFFLKNRESEKWRDRAFDAFKNGDVNEQARQLRDALTKIEAADGA